MHLQKIVARLQVAAAGYDLKDRHICVLSTIVSFARDSTADGRVIVFASNDALCRRGYGMNVQRLQRTLRELIAAGFIHRKSSPNGKRYVHRNSDGGIVEAYGIDLAPLFVRETEIEQAATEAEDLSREIARWRDKISSLRHIQPDCVILLASIRNALRQKPELDRLKQHYVEIANAYKISAENSSSEQILNCNAYQNDMHDQSSIQSIKEEQSIDNQVTTNDVQPTQLIEICTEAVSFAEHRPQNWRDLHALANRLAPMIGISQYLAGHGLLHLGQNGFTTTILCLVQKLKDIRQPISQNFYRSPTLSISLLGSSCLYVKAVRLTRSLPDKYIRLPGKRNFSQTLPHFHIEADFGLVKIDIHAPYEEHLRAPKKHSPAVARFMSRPACVNVSGL